MILSPRPLPSAPSRKGRGSRSHGKRPPLPLRKGEGSRRVRTSGAWYKTLATEALAASILSNTALTIVPAIADPSSLQSVKLELPFGNRMFPDGPGVQTANNNCLACHSAGMVLNQPALSRKAWEEEVNKMRNTYKAPIPAEDVPTIVAYLANVKGAK